MQKQPYFGDLVFGMGSFAKAYLPVLDSPIGCIGLIHL